MRPAALAATLSGRADERARLLDVVRAGLDGSPRAVLVHGEAGIGKTSLVRSVCEQVAGEGAQVLWGQSLRFGAVEAMYHPLVLALEGWLGEADDAERASVIEAVPGAALILPSLGASPPDGPSMLMMVVDALLSRVIARGPTVLVVDDVQWADPATWDALSYLVAGFARQRLALVTTHRDEAAVSEQFQHWLGNVRRLPGTEELVLTRLDQDATGDQIAELLGRPPPPRLVEQVYETVSGQPVLQRAAGTTRRPRLRRAARRPARRAQPGAARRLAGDVSPSAGDHPDPRHRRPPDRPADAGGHRRGARRLPGRVGPRGRRRRGGRARAMTASGSGTRCWPRSWPSPTCPARRRRCTRPGPLTWSRSRPTVSTSCAGWATSRRTTSVPATGPRRSPPSSRVPTSPRSSARLARPPTCWSGRPTCGRWVPTPPTPSAVRGCSSAPAIACEWVGRAQDGYRLLRAARDLVSPERDPLWASRLTRAGGEHRVQPRRDSGHPLAMFERAVELSGVDPDSREHAEALAQLCQRLVLGRAE